MQEANREGHVLRDSLYRNTQEREMNTERGTCMPVGGWGAGGQVGGQPLNPRARPVSTVPAGALTPGAEELLTLPKILPLESFLWDLESLHFQESPFDGK